MQILHIPPNLFPFPAKPLPKPCYPPKSLSLSLSTFSSSKLSVKAVPEDNIPVYTDSFLEQYSLQGGEYEDEYRRRNWIESGWAPWEEILSPEGVFARTSLNEGEEVALQTPEAIEAFRMLRPSYRKKKMEEMGLTEDDYYRNQFKIKGEIPEKLETIWAGPLVVKQVAPRDWPPRGWEVDKEELEFIRGSHRMMQEGVRLGEEELKESNVRKDTDDMCLERYKVFLKQYNEWVAANKDRLEEESYMFDQDYHPGRRKRGKDYKEGMYELPFYYPGQICLGKVTTLHLYQGAFVDIGGVYEGWVPIKNNDWYWIRHHIKVGKDVMVEILAKRDPFRFRFPIEMRFVDPNIDHLIFNRFEFPPIIERDGDINPEEIRRECGRPPLPRKDPGVKVEEEPLLSNHPYVDQIWQLHVAEQMILDDMQINPDKYKGKKLSELTDDEEINHENSVEHTKVQYKKSTLRKTIRRTSVKELDLEAAYAERQHHNKLAAEAKERGEKYKISKLRRNIEMDEYDLLHWRRSFEERETLLRDISCRRALGLPVVEPGRYDDKNYIGKDDYDPSSPLHQYDYWGEPKNSKRSRKERMEVYHNMSVVGKSPVWYEMSYEDAIKQQMEREAKLEEAAAKAKELDIEASDAGDKGDEDEDSDADDDFMYDLLSKVGMDDVDDQPVVNGTQSSSVPDDDFFDD